MLGSGEGVSGGGETLLILFLIVCCEKIYLCLIDGRELVDNSLATRESALGRGRI